MNGLGEKKLRKWQKGVDEGGKNSRKVWPKEVKMAECVDES